MACKVYVPDWEHRDGRDEPTEVAYSLPAEISAATYAMRNRGVVSVPIYDDADLTPRRLHVSGRVDVVGYHVGPHYRGAPDPLQAPPTTTRADDDTEETVPV